jgi:hypothetical protein
LFLVFRALHGSELQVRDGEKEFCEALGRDGPPALAWLLSKAASTVCGLQGLRAMRMAGVAARLPSGLAKRSRRELRFGSISSRLSEKLSLLQNLFLLKESEPPSFERCPGIKL